jgi:hypothetical protein
MIKEFKKLSWFFIWALLLAGCMLFCNFTGYRVFSFSNQQQWQAGGAGYHK